MIKRLRIKFVCINMTIVTAMLLVIFGMVLQFTQENLENQSIRMMQNVAENERVQPGRPGESWEEVQLPFFFVTIDFRGEMTAASGGYYDLSDEEQVLQIIQQARNTDAETGILKEYKMRFQKRTMPFGEAMVFVDISSEIATMENLVKTCVFIGIISFSVFLGLSFWLARWAVKPVETAWNQQRQFVADASHELKTPLTVIMTNAELLQSPEYTDADRRRFSDSILTMSHQMRGLVESLLELARVDNGAAKMVFSEFDFSEQVSDGLLPFEPVYFEKELLLESEIEEGLKVKGSQAHLRQVLDILLDNAAKYASPQGTVTVKLKRQGNHCLLSVANPGEQISKEDLKNIFKRFYRIDKVRSMNHSYGLGLSIADSIVKEHGGRIWAESAEGINTFFVQLTAV
ncbi:MAG: HAMP domain-containing sensor histidine kinase [Oscillospiraceae bacterium]|nr:HAMP domain-containing sensor histidine kinase [Oscillospiraceae bacterium]